MSIACFTCASVSLNSRSVSARVTATVSKSASVRPSLRTAAAGEERACEESAWLLGEESGRGE